MYFATLFLIRLCAVGTPENGALPAVVKRSAEGGFPMRGPSMMPQASPGGGTRCATSVFEQARGILHMRPPRSNSDHSASSSSDCRVPVRMRIWMTEPKGTAYPLQLVKAPPPPHQPEPDRALSGSGGFIPVTGEGSRIPRATAHLKKAFSRGPRPRRQTA